MYLLISNLSRFIHKLNNAVTNKVITKLGLIINCLKTEQMNRIFLNLETDELYLIRLSFVCRRFPPVPQII